MNPRIVVSIVILIAVIGIAAWSKLRFAGHEGFDAPQRWRIEDYPGFQHPSNAGASSRRSTDGG